MPRLYVANCTRRRHIFAYRIPDDENRLPQRDAAYMQPIEPGGQVQIGGNRREFSTPQINAIVEQQSIYGLIYVSDIGNTTDICDSCYSIDKPVSLEQIQRLITRNDQFLAVKGTRIREAAALAAHASIEQTLREQAIPGNVNSLEMSVDEEERGSRPDDIKPVAEGVQVTPFVQGRRTVPSGPGGRPISNREESAPKARRRRA